MDKRPDPAVSCPACGGASFSIGIGQDHVPHCDYCGQALIPFSGHCPHCEADNERDARTCGACGALLSHPCPACGALNPLDTPTCVVCSQALTAVDALFQRITTKTEDQLRRARDKGHQMKVQEEEASRARLARMWADEEREREALEEARARQKRRDRRLIVALAILVGLGILAVLVLLTVLGPNPSPF